MSTKRGRVRAWLGRAQKAATREESQSPRLREREGARAINIPQAITEHIAVSAAVKALGSVTFGGPGTSFDLETPFGRFLITVQRTAPKCSFFVEGAGVILRCCLRGKHPGQSHETCSGVLFGLGTKTGG